jgi:hypothetical protein
LPGRFQRFLLAADRDHLVAGGLQHALAKQGEFLVGGEDKNLHLWMSKSERRMPD